MLSSYHRTPPGEKQHHLTSTDFSERNGNQWLTGRWRKSMECCDVMFQSTIGCKFSLLVADWLNRHILYGWSLESWGGGGGVGRWWRYQHAVEIPTRHHLCSASGFYSSNRLTNSISIPGIPQQLIIAAHFPKDTVYSCTHDPGFMVPYSHCNSILPWKQWILIRILIHYPPPDYNQYRYLKMRYFLASLSDL